jgi:hypothetical protein
VAAGDAAAEVFAVRDAIVHYERARDVLVAGERQGTPLKTSIPHVERLYAQLGRAHELTDEWGEARAAYETMLAFARGGGREAGGGRPQPPGGVLLPSRERRPRGQHAPGGGQVW